jgi:hypothetical protein
MITMWFALVKGAMPFKVEMADAPDAAGKIWDMMVSAGFHAVSKRP